MKGLVLLAAVLASPPGPAGVFWKSDFGRQAVWNDGNAEVSSYDARDVLDGIPSLSRATLIVVAEDLSREALVKADRPAGEPTTRRVLKFNYVRSIPTGVTSLQQMLSVFLGVERLDPIKLSMSSHDGCGNSFVEWRSDQGKLSLRSYFEPIGDRDLDLTAGESLFYDSLPLKLRGLDFARSTEGRVSLIDTVFASNPAPPGRVDALVRVLQVAGSVNRVEVTRGQRTDRFDFESAYPHRMLRWERADGGTLTLVDSRRIRYWERNHPGDEGPPPPAAP